ncbi:MAG: hypothetical protein GXY23_15400 [Myxococcales bacterium]|nr:hypothetical protein [Myxococcales bacterium]
MRRRREDPRSVRASARGPGGETLSITLQGENSKTFRIVEPPAHGTLAGEPPELTYVPHAHFLGRDSFTFALDDSAPAAVEISVLHTPF